MIVIVGPTAVGKTALAIALAKEFKTEIISSDSRQFFREITIGTAKPGEQELAAVPHHFINSHSIADAYDAAQFGTDALNLISDLFKSKDTVIMCGGSGLYIKAVLEGFDEMPPVPEEIRKHLNEHFESKGIKWLQHKMQEVDPDLLSEIDKNNPHRLIRALEIKMATGQSIASFRKNKKIDHPFHITKVGLELPREVLNQRIDLRIDHMIEQGLFEEVKSLYPYKTHNALQTVGYQEIFDFMDGMYDRDEAIRLLKRNSRRYAKRQMTWFKRDGEIKWFHPDQLHAVLDYIERSKRRVQN